MKSFLIVVGLLLTGCSEEKTTQKVDQCLRREIFKECMTCLPKGPDNTKYNDWDETVSECASVAYYQSIRQAQFVKPECRSN